MAVLLRIGWRRRGAGTTHRAPRRRRARAGPVRSGDDPAAARACGARRTAARRLGEFTARVRAGLEEREAQLQQQFGVRSPVDHTANHPAAPDDAVPPAGVPWHPVTSHDSSTDPEDPRARVIEHTPSEGNER